MGYADKSARVIKSHLDDLGPGKTVAKKWRPGEQYLIKIPSKHEPTNIKKALIKILETQGVEVDIVTTFPKKVFGN